MIKKTIRYLLGKLIKFACRSNLIKVVIEKEIKAKPESNQFKFVNPSSAIFRELNIIPSQTTEGERNYLYHFFRSQWTGRGNVIEIGPFLGGTTRAIAMGMLENPRRGIASQLYTFDRFEDYFNVNNLKQYLEPLLKHRQISAKNLKKLGNRAQFIDLFKSIHSHHAYYNCIVPSNHGVPDRAKDKHKGKWLKLPKSFNSDAVFIDGCKSWYGTKFFMQAISHSVKPGTVFIFQDFGWFTCFWLAAFIETFNDLFDLIGYVHNTYVFRLNHNINFNLIETQFPDCPYELGPKHLSNLLNNQILKAIQRDDNYAALRHTLHKVAGLAYLNQFNEAKIIMKQVEKMKNSTDHKDVIEMAWKSPTYTPDGPIYF